MEEVADVASSSGVRPRTTLLGLPAGYHFAPTEEELIVHYLRRKIFKDFNVVSSRPEQIAEDCGEDRWFFFTKRDAKYGKGNRPNRTTPGNGFWKATGPQRLIYSGKKQERRLVGRVRTPVFYQGPEKDKGRMSKKALSEDKTSWTMYEYENLTSEEEAADQSVNKLDEYVLCTIQKQKKKEDGKEAGSENKVKKTKGKGKIKEDFYRAGEKKVKEAKGNGEVKAGTKKRKAGKQEKIKAEKGGGTDQDPIQDLHLMKRSKVPTMLPAHLESDVCTQGRICYGDDV